MYFKWQTDRERLGIDDRHHPFGENSLRDPIQTHGTPGTSRHPSPALCEPIFSTRVFLVGEHGLRCALSMRIWGCGILSHIILGCCRVTVLPSDGENGQHRAHSLAGEDRATAFRFSLRTSPSVREVVLLTADSELTHTTQVLMEIKDHSDFHLTKPLGFPGMVCHQILRGCNSVS